jgi:hypothetical protein
MTSSKTKNLNQNTCHHCGRKKVEISIHASQLVITSNANFKTKKVDPNLKLDFCSTACVHEWMDTIIQEM